MNICLLNIIFIMSVPAKLKGQVCMTGIKNKSEQYESYVAKVKALGF